VEPDELCNSAENSEKEPNHDFDQAAMISTFSTFYFSQKQLII